MHDIALFSAVQHLHEVGRHIDVSAFRLQNDVVLLKGIRFPRRLAADQKGHLPVSGKQNKDDQKSGDDVHQRPRSEHDDPLPGFPVVERTGIGVVFILPLEGAESPERQKPDGKILAVFPLFPIQLGAESDGEFLDAEAENFARDIVPELVHGDHQKQ